MIKRLADLYDRLREAASGWSAFSSAAIVLSPLAFIFFGLDLEEGGTIPAFRGLCSSLALIFTVSIGLFWDKHPKIGKFLAIGDTFACIGAAGKYIFNDPFSALTIFAAVSVLINAVIHYKGHTGGYAAPKHQAIDLEAVNGAVGGFVSLFFITWLLCGFSNRLGLSLCACGGLICQLIFYKWSRITASKIPQTAVLFCFFLICFSFSASGTWLTVISIFFSIFVDIFIASSYGDLKLREDLGIDFFINRPARFLLFTFVLLCTVGSILLYLPISSHNSLEFIDAAFIAVSASCVTGLTCIDIDQFTVYGKIFIVMLVQLGGLGMMGTASLAMHAMGRRLSLRHERLLASLSESESGPNLIRSLYIIGIYVFILELLGGLIMTWALINQGMAWKSAVGRAFFMAVTAFCNAGMTYDSFNMVTYAQTPVMLYTVAFLVILGSMSPLTFLAVPLWFKRRHISLVSFLALSATMLLLSLGTVLYLLLEWNGVFAHLNLPDKFHNAFFLSAVGRTAGFNSVDVSGLAPLSVIISLVFMLIGGCPGGTAGGMKTVTIAIMLLAFWSDLNQEKEVVCRRRLIPHHTVRRTVTIFVAFMLTLACSTILLLLTQNIAPKLLIFEAVSALGTVGMSLGATPNLDEIGKDIIIFTMFCGRIGPISMFAVMADNNPVKHEVGYPQENIPLT
ncbi:MAG: TrkH family potassium uptake protein [Candidatus Bruticola sp.]